MHTGELRRRYPRVTVDATVIYAEDAGIFTPAGTTAGIDLCLELIRRDHGAAGVNALARRMVTPPHRAADQAQYMPAPVPPAGAPPLAEAADRARQHLAEPIRLRDLAARASLSERQLTRRFLREFDRAPGDWLTRERLRRAQELLETTGFSHRHHRVPVRLQHRGRPARGVRRAPASLSPRDYRLARAD